MEKKEFGVVGLGVMGQNLALNIERHGFSVAGYDLDAHRRSAARRRFSGKNLVVAESLSELADSLAFPRKILIMVPAGRPVDDVIRYLKYKLAPGDVLIDGGNSYYADTNRRIEGLEGSGILYVGAGISGGEEGALNGPSIMPGGTKAAWPIIKPIFQAIAAKAPGGAPCCEWIGPGGAGHFVKMVHNGIEYADMQMICEAYFLMERVLGLSAEEMSAIFEEWNSGKLNSYLIHITSLILKTKDSKTGKPMIDVILDKAGQKGTGKWTGQIALDLGVPAMTITEAVFARALSALKNERTSAAEVLEGPGKKFTGNRRRFTENIRRTLFASKICAYAQGFQLMRSADAEFNWNLDFAGIARLWREGCIIRAQFLDRITAAFARRRDLPNLLLDNFFSGAIRNNQQGWRQVVATAATLGIPIPAFYSALAYYDGYRAHRLPANLLQAQRDFFGAHTFERVDKKEGQFFHFNWRTDEVRKSDNG